MPDTYIHVGERDVSTILRLLTCQNGSSVSVVVWILKVQASLKELFQVCVHLCVTVPAHNSSKFYGK